MTMTATMTRMEKVREVLTKISGDSKMLLNNYTVKNAGKPLPQFLTTVPEPELDQFFDKVTEARTSGDWSYFSDEGLANGQATPVKVETPKPKPAPAPKPEPAKEEEKPWVGLNEDDGDDGDEPEDNEPSPPKAEPTPTTRKGSSIDALIYGMVVEALQQIGGKGIAEERVREIVREELTKAEDKIRKDIQAVLKDAAEAIIFNSQPF
jgi:hypothetical protein